MQFVVNGPDVPEELLQAHEDGQVVFFCGAGISYPAKLPGFHDLVMGIYTELGETPDSVEAIALKKQTYDTAIGLLETRVIDRSMVRKAIQKILTPNLSLPEATSTHEALLSLSKSNLDQRLRLITTNFDRLFVEGMSRMGATYPSYYAPQLPIPKKAKWDGLVYLHGFLPENPSVADLERLVASSGDFGLAYLTERWASRFVSELFRAYTVCFVGYSLDDPVLRYMMDALAADRLIGERSPDAYAFGSFKTGDEDETARIWKSKNVSPILYNADNNDHSLLHKTLRVWSEAYRDGVGAKQAIAIQHGRSKPLGSTKQDNFIGRMLWALSDRSGLPAKTFADLDPPAPIEWLLEFERPTFGHRDLVRFQVTPNVEPDKNLKYSIVERPWSYATGAWMRLVSRRGHHAGSLDPIMLNLARWLARHLSDARTLLWVARNGAVLEDNFAFQVRQSLETATLSPLMRTYWELMLAGRVSDTSSFSELYDWTNDLKRTGRLTPVLRMQIRDLLAPRITLREGYKDSDEDNQSIDWELIVGGPHAASALREISGGEAWQSSLPELLSDFSELLRDALDIRASLSKDKLGALTFYLQPSVAPHPQNRSVRGWTVLIDLTRDAWLKTATVDAARAKREFERWDNYHFPVFRRLQFFALTAKLELFGGRLAVDRLLQDEGKWLWASETQREALLLIAAIAPKLNRRDASLLTSRILLGPSLGSEEIAPERKERLGDREIWRRLGVFNENGGFLSVATRKKLAQLEASYPKWGPVEERDQFPFYMQSGDIGRQYEKTPIELGELKAWLSNHREVDEFDQGDDFFERCRNEFEVTSQALVDLANAGDWLTARWSEGLRAWTTEEGGKQSWPIVGPILALAPDEVIATLDKYLSSWLQTCGRHASSLQDPYFRLAERIMDLHAGDHYEPHHSPLNDAFNQPVGQIADGLFKLWYSTDIEDGQTLSPPFRACFTKLADTNKPGRALGRLFLCSNAVSLFRVDERWTRQYIIPLFDWTSSETEALVAWSGFLWSPRLYASLLAAVRDDFLDVGKHYESLGDLSENYAGLLTFIALEGTGIYERSEISKATAALPEDGLVRAIQTVADGLEGAGAKADDYWDNRVEDYFRFVWPKSKALATPRVSSRIARLIVDAGDKFERAYDLLGAWLQPSEDMDLALHELASSEIPTKFPRTALEFVHRLITGRTLKWRRRELKSCLESIVAADPSLAGDHRMKKMSELVYRE